MTDGPTQPIDDRFVLGSLIGSGAMGDVYRGRDVRLDREVAIKLLRAEVAGTPDAVRRFTEEARSAARLNHPAIVKVFDSGQWLGTPYLVMECLPGRTLADELPAAPLPETSVRRIGADVAGALAAAHGAGVVHRDVKPSNILLVPDGGAKLADFGIAKTAESLDHTQTGFVVGTPAYLAPERLEGLPATPESDVYGLGVVLYQALTGERPFSGETPIALALAVHAGVPRPVAERNPGVSPSLAAAVDAAMARDPEARPSASELLTHLRDPHPTITTGTMTLPVAPAGSQVETPAEPMEVTGPRSWRTAAAAIGVAVAFAAGVVVLGARDEDPSPPAQPTTAPDAAVPQPLADALDRLDEAVGS